MDTSEEKKVVWSFFDDLFRSLSYDIGNPHAGNPAIPVYFSIGDFGSTDTKSLPPLIDVTRAKCAVVFVLLDSEFRKAPDEWNEFFNEMRERAKNSATDLRLLPIARSDDGNLRMDIQRLDLVPVAPVYAHRRHSRSPIKDVARFFRINAMIMAIKAIRENSENKRPIEIFISYARRDGEDVANNLRREIDEYSGLKAVVDTLAFGPGTTVYGTSVEKKLMASSCVVIFQTASYSNRLWCQREALLAKRCEIPMIVVGMRDGLERRGCDSLTNCPHLDLKGGIEDRYEEIVELAVSEILRIAHHRSRSAALLELAGIDPQRVEILVRKPELLRLIDLVAANNQADGEGRRLRDLVLHPDPALREHELNVLKTVDPKLQFLTPSTILVDSIQTEAK